MKFTTDKLGILVQAVNYLPSHFDGGDSLNWQAHRLYLENRELSIYHYVLTFESKKYPGLFLRHPDPEYSQHGFASYCEGNFRGTESRDQMTGKLCLLAKFERRRPLWRSFREHAKRGLIFANNTITNGANPNEAKRKIPDLTLFGTWALYIRGFRAWYLYPLLCVFDLHLLCSAIINRFSSNRDPISFILRAILANEVMPTPAIGLMNRLINPGKAMHELITYWSGWRGQPGMPHLYEERILRFFRG